MLVLGIITSALVLDEKLFNMQEVGLKNLTELTSE